MPEKVSAGGLLESLKYAFNLKSKKAEGPPPAATEAPAIPLFVSPTPEASQPVTPEAAVTQAPPAQESVSAPTPELAPEPAAVAPAGELPDWLSAPTAEPMPAPEPEAPAEVPVAPAAELPALVLEAPVVEAPAVKVSTPLSEAKAESDPFAINREFNGYMKTIRQAQAVLASGITLNPEEQEKALIAVARSNSLLPKLPPEVLESVLLMRAVASGNPKFGRDDFQIEMLTTVDVIKTGTAVKG